MSIDFCSKNMHEFYPFLRSHQGTSMNGQGRAIAVAWVGEWSGEGHIQKWSKIDPPTKNA